MSKRTFYKMCAVFLILSAICDLPSNIIENPTTLAILIFTPLLGMVAYFGLYLKQRKESGLFGLIALVVFILPLAYLPVFHSIRAFVFPYMDATNLVAVMAGPFSSVMTYGVMGFVIGVVLFGISILQARVFPRIPTILLMIAYIPMLFLNIVPPIIVMVFLFMGDIASFWLGLSLWKMANETRLDD